MLSPGELKRGQIIDIDGAPCLIEKITVQTPTSRGVGTLWKVRARDLKQRRKVDKTYKGGDAIAVPNFEKRPVQFLYQDAGKLHFMDLQDYNQFALARDSCSGATTTIRTGAEMQTDSPRYALALTSYGPGGKGRLARSVRSSAR